MPRDTLGRFTTAISTTQLLPELYSRNWFNFAIGGSTKRTFTFLIKANAEHGIVSSLA